MDDSRLKQDEIVSEESGIDVRTKKSPKQTWISITIIFVVAIVVIGASIFMYKKTASLQYDTRTKGSLTELEKVTDSINQYKDNKYKNYND